MHFQHSALSTLRIFNTPGLRIFMQTHIIYTEYIQWSTMHQHFRKLLKQCATQNILHVDTQLYQYEW